MDAVLKIPLLLTPQPEGGYTVTSPLLPELVTEGDSLEAVLENVQDALRAVLELYEERARPLPGNLSQNPQAEPIWFEYLWSGR
ncbi:MAG: type II toxin-antitoxin system HicB family antitoxin [Candidatus Lambdaproteobacteria bacterium]|nr:type II toxin-antitoxin system HicB family antitoxin [Candidatus Lambdaproteobacteria bacterium]